MALIYFDSGVENRVAQLCTRKKHSNKSYHSSLADLNKKEGGSRSVHLAGLSSFVLFITASGDGKKCKLHKNTIQ